MLCEELPALQGSILHQRNAYVQLLSSESESMLNGWQGHDVVARTEEDR